MTFKLYARPASFRAQKIIIAAQYCGASAANIEIITDFEEKTIKNFGPITKLPLLETTDGSIAESNAIARYLCSLSPSCTLLGPTKFTAAQIDSWIDFCANEIEVPATVHCYPLIGWMTLHAEAFDKARKDLMVSLQNIEAHLKTRTFLVGERISLADISLVCALLLPFKLVLDEKVRKSFPCTTRWFLTCVNQKEFVKVIGETELCKVALSPPEGASAAPAQSGADEKPKKDKKEKKEKPAKPAKEKKKEEEAEEDDGMPLDIPVEKKEKHYCESLPPSKFIMDAWKRQYSNAPGGDCYKVMPWFWENLDQQGYCLYTGDYKYNDELKVNFMVSNLAAGFIQRCDEIRKFAFGVIQILKSKEGEGFEIISCWLFRGDSNKLMIEANPDAESYAWTKLDPNDEPTRARVAHLWCAGEQIDGKDIVDCKVFK